MYAPQVPRSLITPLAKCTIASQSHYTKTLPLKSLRISVFSVSFVETAKAFCYFEESFSYRGKNQYIDCNDPHVEKAAIKNVQ